MFGGRPCSEGEKGRERKRMVGIELGKEDWMDWMLRGVLMMVMVSSGHRRWRSSAREMKGVIWPCAMKGKRIT